MKRSVLLLLLCGRPLGLVAQAAQAPAGDTAFVLATDDPSRTPSPFTGNGRLGVVIPALGIGPTSTYLAGVYEHGDDDVPRIVGAPAWNAIDILKDDGWLSASRGEPVVSGYRQVLDMRTGTARTSYHWGPPSRELAVLVETFTSRAEPHLAVTRLTLTPRAHGSIRVRFALAGAPPPPRLPLAKLTSAPPDWKPDDLWYPGHMEVVDRDAVPVPGGARLTLTSKTVGRKILLGQAAITNWPDGLAGARVERRVAGDTASVEVAFDAVPGRTYSFVQVTSFITSAEASEPLARATRAAALAARPGYDALAGANAREWAHLWKSDIRIDGNPALQRVVRSMLFYLLCSARQGMAIGIPPMGLSSAGYYGHIFWDSDTWMFPPLLLTHPEIARSLVAFRARTLAAAWANARLNGYRGAMYPWEADERGRETTPRFAIQNALSEVHVNGDVAVAQWQYYLATGDSAWLAREGFPVIQGTADFWLSRSVYDSSDGKYHIRNVVSVSEGLIGISDDAYTNAVARKNLEIAADASRRLGKLPDRRWTLVAAKLHLPYDSASEFFRTYEGAPDSTLGWVTPLLAYPLGVPMSPRAKRAQIEQAIARLLERGPEAMMGSTILAVGAAELNDRALVDSLLPLGFAQYVKGPFLMLSETPSNNAVNFVTGAGGLLQQVIFGWTGLRLGRNGLEPAFAPLLPSGIRQLVLCNISVRSKRYDVIVDSLGRRIVATRCGAAR
jgi:trehalose/maltose hydrolase-like predicted phosphorylase